MRRRRRRLRPAQLLALVLLLLMTLALARRVAGLRIAQPVARPTSFIGVERVHAFEPLLTMASAELAQLEAFLRALSGPVAAPAEPAAFSGCVGCH